MPWGSTAKRASASSVSASSVIFKESSERELFREDKVEFNSACSESSPSPKLKLIKAAKGNFRLKTKILMMTYYYWPYDIWMKENVEINSHCADQNILLDLCWKSRLQTYTIHWYRLYLDYIYLTSLNWSSKSHKIKTTITDLLAWLVKKTFQWRNVCRCRGRFVSANIAAAP